MKNIGRSTSEPNYFDDCIDKKIELFENLADEVNKIEGQERIILNDPTFNPSKDALAFYIECIHRMYNDVEWSLMVDDLINKIQKYNEIPRRHEGASKATWVLDQTIQTLYQAVITEKIDLTKNKKEKEKWKSIRDIIYIMGEIKHKTHENGNPVSYEGIDRSILPKWYLDKYC